LNCERCQELIDIRPIGDYSSAVVALIERHARECSECRPRLDAERVLAASLGRLPDAGTPHGAAESVLAAIERLDERAPDSPPRGDPA
jgi:predicted anti-sigma-YlaC factor YlaD